MRGTPRPATIRPCLAGVDNVLGFGALLLLLPGRYLEFFILRCKDPSCIFKDEPKERIEQ